MPLFPDALARLLAPLRATPVSVKDSRVGPLIAYETLGGPVWSPRDYAAFAREGFMTNAVVYRCVRMICEAAATVPLCLYDGNTEIEDHPLLALLRRPNPHQTGAEFLESFLGFLLVSGNAYVEGVALDGTVRELYTLRPDRMTIIPGQSGWPDGYIYTAAGGQVTFADDIVPDVRPVLHMRLFHPVDDHYGFSPLEAAATAIDLHNQASKWNKALLDNAARPSGALVYAAREGRLSPEQFERLKQELQDGFAGAKNAGRPLLLEGGLDWKPLSLSPKDMDFIEAKHAAAREIALALGVPPMLLGIPGDNTFSNYQEANRTFWRNTVVPLVAKASQSLSTWLAPAFGDAILALEPDLDDIEALAPERDALWARLENTSFLTDDEKRSAIGYRPKGSATPADKFNPFHDDLGRFTSGPGGTADVHLAQARARAGAGFRPISPAQAQRLDNAASNARGDIARVQERDPTWRPQPQLTDPMSAEGRIAAYEAMSKEAQARLSELLKDSCPAINPNWSVRRVENGLRDNGYIFSRRTDSPGKLFRNPTTGEDVRIMERPATVPYRTESTQKRLNDYYYRYRPGFGKGWGQHITIPNS
jgi:HK97 family phage portal protein